MLSSHLRKFPRTYVCLFVPSFLLSFILLTMKLPQKCYPLPRNDQLLVFCYISTFSNALWHLIFKLSSPLTSKTWLTWLSLFPLTTPCGPLFLCCPSSVDSAPVLFILHLTCSTVDLLALCPELPQYISPGFTFSVNSTPYFHLLSRQLHPDIS